MEIQYLAWVESTTITIKNGKKSRKGVVMSISYSFRKSELKISISMPEFINRIKSYILSLKKLININESFHFLNSKYIYVREKDFDAALLLCKKINLPYNK